jgi:glycosyltransferase involved in cell wall biosynthesis
MILDVSVVICTQAGVRWEALLTAIDSIRCQTIQPREFILIVDGDPALAAQARLTLPDVVVAENREAPGLSGARHTGINLARGSVLAFLDDDACVEPGWLEHLLAGYRNSRVVGVGGSIEPRLAQGSSPWFSTQCD